MRRLGLTLLLLVPLGACTSGSLVTNNVSGTEPLVGGMHAWGSPFNNALTLGIVDVVSIVNTQKTVLDHGLSMASGRDCSSVRAEQDGQYCVDRKPLRPPPAAVAVYCYRSLAAVTCYDTALATDHTRLVGAETMLVPQR